MKQNKINIIMGYFLYILSDSLGNLNLLSPSGPSKHLLDTLNAPLTPSNNSSHL